MRIPRKIAKLMYDKGILKNRLTIKFNLSKPLDCKYSEWYLRLF